MAAVPLAGVPAGAETIPRFERYVPALAWRRELRGTAWRRDVVAGLVTGAVVIPQAMAYGTVAGLPVQVGLYTCIVPMLVYAVLGGSRRMSISTTSTIVALTGAALVAAHIPSTPSEAIAGATTLTLLVGVVLLVARVLRLGFLVECVSEPVLIGLKVGVGLTIAASQLPALFGITSHGSGFFRDVGDTFGRLGSASATTAAIGVVSVAALLAMKRWLPRVPGPLIAVLAGIALVAVFGLDQHGVAVIPEVPRGLPLPSVPPFGHLDVLTPYAIAIGLMAYLESVSVARMTRQVLDPPLDNGQELVAVGAASIAGSFFQCVPAAGGFSQTLVNQQAGASTQLSEVVTAGLAIVVALALAPVLHDLPQTSLAAIVLVVVLGLISVSELARLWRVDRVELFVAAVTGAAALVIGLLAGVLIGVLLTFYLLLRAINHPVVVELRRARGSAAMLPPPDGSEAIPGLLVLRVEGPLYTANVRSVQTELLARAEDADPRVVVVDVGGTADTSITVMDVFVETNQRLEQLGVTLWFAALPTRVLQKAARTGVWADWVADGRIHASVGAAVRDYERGIARSG